jgi:predicted peptidase
MKKPAYIYLFIIFIIHFSLFTITDLMAQQKGMYLKVEVKKDVTLEVRFLLYLPEGYHQTKEKYPLLLFLHGMDERGEMLDFVKKHGPPRLIEQGKDFPFIVVSPQCPEDTVGWSVEVLNMLLDEMESRYRVKKNCIFVTGLSMGGAGTWNLAITYPKRFAAIAPVCGWADPEQAAKIKDLPIWVFHGAKDDVVPAERSISMVNALKALGSPVKFTLYPYANHDSWTDTYNNPEFWEWLTEQCK